MRVGANVGLKPLMNGAKRGRYCARFCEDECCQFLLAKIEQKAKLPFPEKAGRNANMSGTRSICISITATPTENTSSGEKPADFSSRGESYPNYSPLWGDKRGA